MQMASAARLASTFPQVGEQLRQRYRVVLLDEYQDTGHAQRVALSSLFGRGVDDDLALTAVGDPIQSIYGWRGASATNLPRFTTDFPRADGTPAPTLELRTSWRNPPRALHLANAVSTEARRRSVAVRALRPRPDAQPGVIRCALLSDVAAERDWVADHLARLYHGARSDGCRRADGGGAGASQCRCRTDGRCARRARRPCRGRRARRAARRARGCRRGGDAAPGGRSHRRRRGDAGAHRAAVATGGSRHRRAVATSRRTRRQADAQRHHRADRRAGRRRRRRRLPCRRDLRSRTRGCVFRGRAPSDRRAGPRADRAARPPVPPAARSRRRGAPGARSRRRGTGGQAGVIGLVRHRAPRRVRRRGCRLRGQPRRHGAEPAGVSGCRRASGERPCARRSVRRQ